ncbi:glycosyltransferase family 4 protein [Microbaculum marinum]|uniref:Glycosyltransferase family 4 protein n=1 Tax=Microbaculum marinum TaxID=1764581 RepID=A0AAW9RXS2_9HYPH
MKILIIYRHYWPDTPPLGSMLRTIAEHLAARGHRVFVVTAQPSYQGRKSAALPKREFKGGVRIIRLPLPAETGGMFMRSVNALLFQVSAFSYAARHRFDLVWANTLPPVYSGFNAMVSARACGARLLYHMQDVYPEVWRHASPRPPGALKRALIGVLATIDSWTCRSASAVVVLSEDMMRTVADRGGNGAVAFHVINNFVQQELKSDTSPPKRLETSDFRLVFSGNIGRFQNLQLLVEAMALIDPAEGISLEFIGSGVMEETLRETVRQRGLKHVHFNERLPSNEAFQLTRTADLGVISLVPGMYRVSYPSKLMTYLAAGLPVLALIEAESDLAHYLRGNDAGIAVLGDASAVADVIRRARDTFSGEAGIKERMEALAARDFGREAIRERWVRLIDTFVAD